MDNPKGFVLPVAMLLVFMLSIGGLSFQHLDSMERRLSLRERDNLGAFYLASAGVERARETLKADSSSSWTTLLSTGPTLPAPDPDMFIGIPAGDIASLNFVIPSFGTPVTSPDNLVFDPATFDDGQYEVRAFNKLRDDFNVPIPGETGSVDADGILTIRALGTVRGEKKLVELAVRAISGLNMINWTDDFNSNQNFVPVSLPGREPGQVSSLPAMNPPLTDSNNYYRNAANFPDLTSKTVYDATNDSHYLITGDVDVTSNLEDVVIFSTGTIRVTSSVLNRVILIALDTVDIRGNTSLRALPAPTPGSQYPVIIATNAVTKASSSVQIFGTIYAVNAIDFNPVSIEGVLIAETVDLQGATPATTVTDNGNLDYYNFMPGFDYPDDLKGTVALATGSAWKEFK